MYSVLQRMHHRLNVPLLAAQELLNEGRLAEMGRRFELRDGVILNPRRVDWNFGPTSVAVHSAAPNMAGTRVRALRPVGLGGLLLVSVPCGQMCRGGG